MKIRNLALLFALCFGAAHAQLLSVTATLTDTDGTVWANGTCSIQTYNTTGGPSYYNGVAIPTAPSCSINGSGVLSASLYNTSTLAPASSLYSFTIQSNTSAKASTFLSPVTASNMTSTFSALITAPRFNAAPTAFGYIDTEALSGQVGLTYYNVTTPAWRQCTIVTSGSCGTWVTVVGGGGSGAALTFATTGGVAPTSSFNGSTPITIDWHSIGASPLAGSSSLTTVGTLSAGSIPYSLLTGTPTVGTWGALNYPTWASGTPFVKMTAAGTFALDTNTYLTSSAIASTTNLLSGNGSGNAVSSGIAASNVPLLNAANTFTATNTFNNATYSALFTGGNVGIGTTNPGTALVLGSGQITVPSGGASAPSYSFSGATNTGFYNLSGNSDFAISSGGTPIFSGYYFGPYGSSYGNGIYTPNGSFYGFGTGTTLPANIDVAFVRTGADSVALYDPQGSDNVNLQISGGRLGFSAAGANVAGTVDTGLSRNSAGVVDVGNGTPGDISGQMVGAAFGGNLIRSSGASNTTQVQALGTAISGTNQNSGQLFFLGSYFSGSATSDTWAVQNVMGTGASPTTTLAFNHLSGSPGAAVASFPNIKTINTLTTGGTTSGGYLTTSDCASAASPAVCGSAAAGSVLIPTGTSSSTLTVNTTAVTANSQIIFYPDDSLGTRLSTTCNSTIATLVGGSFISARTPGTSFTITFNGTILTNGVCGSYEVIN